jgi:hypothetical protein
MITKTTQPKPAPGPAYPTKDLPLRQSPNVIQPDPRWPAPRPPKK